jgi:hypothetical protein
MSTTDAEVDGDGVACGSAAAVGAGLAPSIGVPGETEDTDVTRKPSAVASAGWSCGRSLLERTAHDTATATATTAATTASAERRSTVPATAARGPAAPSRAPHHGGRRRGLVRGVVVGHGTFCGRQLEGTSRCIPVVTIGSGPASRTEQGDVSMLASEPVKCPDEASSSRRRTCDTENASIAGRAGQAPAHSITTDRPARTCR